MISGLRGRVQRDGEGQLTLWTGGVGYRVQVPLPLYFDTQPGEEITLSVLTVVREDALELFGFAGSEQRQAFEILLGVSRVGPKLALAVLSGMGLADLIRCVTREDTAALARIPGLGRKTAERIILECRDRLDSLMGVLAETSPEGSALPESVPTAHTAVSALVHLGFPRTAATKAVKSVLAEETGSIDEESIIRSALRRMTAKGGQG